jgi:hypothetical protein
MMSDFRYSVDGSVVRVVVVEDVIALPLHGWSMGGFGWSISVEWLLHDARLPGRTKGERTMLARCIVRALDDHSAKRAALTGSAA